MFTLDRVNNAQLLPVNVHDTKMFCSPSAIANKLSPYLREKVVKRMMVHVADAAKKGVKSVMFPTRDMAVVTVSSNCCGHFRCKRNFWCPIWDRKDPNCTSVCKVSLSVCHCSMSWCHIKSIFLQRPQKENCLGELSRCY